MNARLRGIAMLAPAAAAATLMLSGAAAHAAPYTDEPAGSISDTNPAEGGSVTVNLTGFEPRERIGLDLHSRVVRLATPRADALGSLTTTVTLPMGFTCEHFIEARGLTSGLVVRINLVIGDPSDCRDAGVPSDGDDAGSDLPATGAAVGGLTAAGAMLTVGGIALVRRRRS